MASVRVNVSGSAPKAVVRAAVAGVNDALEFLGEQSNRTVPIEEGTLARSMTVVEATVDRPVGAVTYDTPYARRQHEDTRLSHDPGRRAKWLERTFHEQAARVGQHIAAAARKAAP